MVVLNCSARGLPTPTFTWSPSGSMFQVSSSTSMDAEGYAVVTSSLTITNVMRNDTTSFTCSASNSDEMDSHSFTLTIYCKLFKTCNIECFIYACQQYLYETYLCRIVSKRVRGLTYYLYCVTLDM